MVSTGMKVIKYLLFVFNLIFYLAGIVLIVAGALVQTKFRDYFIFFGTPFNGAAILLIVVGVIVFVIAFFGCCGAFRENHFMIMTFAVLLGIVFILEIAAAIAARVLYKDLGYQVVNTMNVTISDYPKAKTGAVWDHTQKTLHCCGSGNFTDWGQNPIYLNSTSVPDSCCIEISKDCGKGVLDDPNPSTIYQEGCADTMIKWAENNILIIGGIALGVAFIQIIGIIIACALAAAIRKDYTPM